MSIDSATLSRYYDDAAWDTDEDVEFIIVGEPVREIVHVDCG